MTPAEAARAIAADIRQRQLDAGPGAIVNTAPYFALAEAFERFADLIDPPAPAP